MRPILEYACPVWSPHLAKDILAIEKVQRRASRIALGQKHREMQYEERCRLLNWNSLQHRREYLSLVECYKTEFRLNGLDFNDYFEYCRSKSTRANHPFKIQTKSGRINAFMRSSIPSLLESLRNGIICQIMCSDTISTTLMQTGSNQTLKSG